MQDFAWAKLPAGARPFALGRLVSGDSIARQVYGDEIHFE
jgi:hypothetical protein